MYSVFVRNCSIECSIEIVFSVHYAWCVFVYSLKICDPVICSPCSIHLIQWSISALCVCSICNVVCTYVCKRRRINETSFCVYLVSVWVCICPELWASSLLMFYWVLTIVGLTHSLWYGVAWLKEHTDTDFAHLCIFFNSELAMLCLPLLAL